MSITILKKETEINAALAVMSPVAAEAAKLLAHRIREDISILQDKSGERFQQEVFQVVGISCARNGIRPTERNPEFERFIENNIHSIMNVGLSIATLKPKNGILIKAALVGLGLVTEIGF